MVSYFDDRWLWVGVGLFFVAAAKGIQYALQDIVYLTRVDQSPYPGQDDDSERPEDSISLDTLRTLASSTNPNIAHAATSLIVSRFLRSPEALDGLLKDTKSSDEATRKASYRAVQFLRDYEYDVRPEMPMDFPPSRSDAPGEFDFELDPSQLLGLAGSRTPSLISRLENLVQADIDETMEFTSSSSSSSSSAAAPAAAAHFAGWDVVPSQRPAASPDLDEAEARRRRRETMVMSAEERWEHRRA